MSKPRKQKSRKPKSRPISGWLILDKPLNFGSTEAVSKIKWLFNAQKAGHAGTLDPLASGMLPIALGDATKTVPYVMDGRKIYEFTVTWGEQRTTDDLEGEVINSSEQRPSEQEIRSILPNYTGVILQTPPQFSAIKIAGARAYDLVCDSKTVEIPAREVEIHRLTLLACPDADTTHFAVECGKGTYVRALARDMGHDLGCFSHISKLRRTMVAPFDEGMMVPFETLTELEAVENRDKRLEALEAFLIDTTKALSVLPHLIINDDQAHRLKMGSSILLRGCDALANHPEAYATAHGKLVAIGKIGADRFRPKRVFS